MNIIMVSPNLPRPWSGSSTRNYHLLRALAREHRVALIALNEMPGVDVTPHVERLREIAHTVEVIELPTTPSKRTQQALALATLRSYVVAAHTLPAVQEALDQLAAEIACDMVIFESVQIAGYRVPPGVRVVIDQHNIEHELQRRSAASATSLPRKVYNWLEYRLLKPVELDRCRRADAVALTSERERDILRALLPDTSLGVVPNAVDLEMFQPTPPAAEVPGRIIFTGALTYHPNVQAVLAFAARCWPLIHSARPDATWQIVGRYPPAEVERLGELPGVSVIPSVPDIRPYLVAAQVALAPMLVGSGTRLKILEAFAMGKAVASTTIGCEGLPVRDGKHLSIADDPEALASAVIRLLNDANARRRYGEAGRALVEQSFGWEASGAALRELVRGLGMEPLRVESERFVWR